MLLGSGIEIELNSEVNTAAIMDLRVASGHTAEMYYVWDEVLAELPCVATARDLSTNALVGLGFLDGNSQIAEVSGVMVDPRYKYDFVGWMIKSALREFAETNHIDLVGMPNFK